MGGQQQMGGQQSVRMVHCSNCATRFPSTSRFCPKCGDPYNPCPKCGTDNDLDARRCISCGAQLMMAGGGAANNCPQCNSPVVPGAAFCGSCGARLVSSNVCGRCGTTMAPGTKFCPACGFKNA
jgi:predicted amidophosphoribosyltransferase